MPIRTMIFLVILILLASLLGYNYFKRPFANLETTSVVPQDNTLTKNSVVDPSAKSQLNAILATLTDQEKIALLLAYPLNLDAPESTQTADLAWIAANHPGVVTLFGTRISTSSATNIINSIKKNNEFDDQTTSPSLTPLIAVDHEGGRVQRLSGDGFTVLPSWYELCQQSIANSTSLLQTSAKELMAVGVDVVFAPVIDIASQSAVLKNRVCAADKTVVKARALAMIKIFQTNSILPVIKHFPGIGQLKIDPHQKFATIVLDAEQVELYQQLLNAIPQLAVMVAHVGINDFGDNIPCSLNTRCLKDLKDNYPESLIFTDALDMEAAGFLVTDDDQSSDQAGQLVNSLSLPARAVQAMLAGNDILVFGPKVTVKQINEIKQVLLDQYQTNDDFKVTVDQSVQKILNYQLTKISIFSNQ